MAKPIDRRTFFKQTAVSGIGLGVLGHTAAWSTGAPSDKIVVGVMGVNGRGKVLAQSFASESNTEVAAICDVDPRAADKAIAAVCESQSVEGTRRRVRPSRTNGPRA